MIAVDHTKPFFEFTQENRDAYLRLKLRSINRRDAHRNHQIEEQKEDFDPQNFEMTLTREMIEELDKKI